MSEGSAPEEGHGADWLSDEVLTENVQALFKERPLAVQPTEREEFFTAFQNLTGIYTLCFYPTLHSHTVFDYAALQMLLQRFQRDAFGVRHFAAALKQMDENDLSPTGRAEVVRELKNLGIRVNTDSPRKTKVAAVFALWASTFRPVHISLQGMFAPHISREDIQEFCGSLTFWLTTTYLSMFGDVRIEDVDGDVRLARIRYDLTYRNLNLSSLEMLHSSIFRARE